jgi:hypothetical protein
MEPLDLRARPPRSCYDELDGLMLMPRTIDKMRAMLPGGHAGEYVINLAEPHIRGISGYLLERLGIAESDLMEAVRTAEDEMDVALWLRERVDTSQYAAINQTLRHIKPKHADDEAFFRNLYAPTLVLHPELEFIIDIVEADDRRLFPNALTSPATPSRPQSLEIRYRPECR